MRKKKTLFCLLLLIVFAILCFCACTDKNDTESEVILSSFSVIDSTIPTDAIVGSVDVTQIQILLTYSNGAQERMTIDESMLNEESRQKLSQVGTHLLTVVYNKKIAKFQMEIHAAEAVYYTLRIYNGVPTYINNVKIINPVKLTGEYYENVYLDGTVVTIEWINDGNNFSYWTANDLQVSTESIINVTVDGNLVYRPYSVPSVNTVSFKTFSNTVLQSKTTNLLNESDISAIYKDNFIFNGWTTDEITESQSLNSYSKNKVSFPYRVGRDITFYATWIPMGVEYALVGDHYEITGYSGNAYSLDLPAKYAGLDVTVLKADALSQKNVEKLRFLSLPSSLTTVEAGAFRYCSHLESIIAEGNETFKSIDGVLYTSDERKLVAYPANRVCAIYQVSENTTSIERYAFANSLVGDVKLSSLITSVGSHAFDSVHIDHVDFSGITPTPTFNVEADAFNSQISTLVAAASNKERLLSLSDELKNHEDKIVTDPSGAHKVYAYTYDEGDGLSVTILYRIIYDKNLVPKNTVTSDKESYASAEILGLYRETTTFAVPIRLAQKGEKAYNVTALADYAFKDCSLLDNIIISFSSNLERVGEEVFKDTPWLVENGLTIQANDVVYKYLGSEKTYTLNVGVKKIAEGAFKNNRTLEYIDLGEGAALTEIAPYAFENCTSLKGFLCEANPDGEGVYLKYAVRSIGEYAFYNTAITSVKLQPSSTKQTNYLAQIGEYAFSECKYLKSIMLSCSTTDIAPTAFIRCISLQEFILMEKNRVFEVYEGILYSYDASGNYTLYAYPAGRLDGEFDPAYVRSYGFSFDYSLEDYYGSSDVEVGSMVFAGTSKHVYLTVCTGEEWVKEYDVLQEKYVLKSKDGALLLPSTEVTVDKDGIVHANGDYYYSIRSGEKQIPLLYDTEKDSYYYYPMIDMYVTFIRCDLSLYVVSGDKNIGTVSISGKSFDLFIEVLTGQDVVVGSDNDTVPIDKESGQKLRQTTSVYYNADGSLDPDSINGEFYYYVYLTDKKDKKVVLLYDGTSSAYYFSSHLNVTAIGTYAFSYSSVSAVKVSSFIGSIGENAFTIPGLQYIRFEANPAIFSYKDIVSDGKPEFIIVPIDTSSSDNLVFFNNNTELMNELIIDRSYEYFFDDRTRNVLYALRHEGDNAYLYVVRTSRVASAIEIPEIVCVGTERYTQSKTIAPYAFYSVYLSEVTLRAVGVLGEHSFSEAYALTALRIKTAFISDVQQNTFNPDLFHNGLYIYDSLNGINLYRDNKNWMPDGTVFTYKDAEGETYAASPYFILDEGEKPFAVITYLDGNGESKTVKLLYGKVSVEDVATIQQSIALDGYDISGWEDDNGNVISGAEEYTIPYNQILTCRWQPQVYKVYFVVSEGEVKKVVGDQKISLPSRANATTGQVTYSADLVYDEAYNFGLFNYNTDRNIFLYWKNGNNETETFTAEGVWQTVLPGREIYLYPVMQVKTYVLRYNVDKSVINVDSDTYVITYDASSFTLSVPTTETYSFLGWYMLADVNGEDVPNNRILVTDGNGKSKLSWLYSQQEEYDLYALWDSLIYYPYGVGVTSVKVNYGENFHLTTPDEDDFSGWCIEVENEQGELEMVQITDENGSGYGLWLYDGRKEYTLYRKE